MDLSERRLCIGNLLSYFTNGYFLGQIGGKIGKELGQNDPCANLI